MDEFRDCIGRSVTVADTLEPARSNALERALGGPGQMVAGDTLPLLGHWLHFWDVQPPGALGRDGHPATGIFPPPAALPRRMWAGGRILFRAPLLLGAAVTRTSTVMSVRQKTGRTGPLLFVTVRHEIHEGGTLAVSEEQDLVYRGSAGGPQSSPAPAAGLPAAPDADWTVIVDPDPVLLFRFSALTMNGHRIHYDRQYAVEEEFYPGLVVQGPLQAILMLRLATAHLARPVTSFEFRGQKPAIDSIQLHICGRRDGADIALWTRQGGEPNMVAAARTAP
ncbi:FAS1-like dehydratase domain-containing protein [Allopontixanthobacter sp.]|uniref:FAS1-like dehydratase domain-containing protein n=1 Tax=Allopontixanthobacter sp. TaxID=2906452 RepID=UPI002AB81081|nr:MaoC family dehydratase N-terminal domain-containing protein [Allopontixanthobacter sp.]MDZ4307284.1 MaoC family dehydratase N-terminal domain-containing protein [Allopontixanthobacter sp.]